MGRYEERFSHFLAFSWHLIHFRRDVLPSDLLQPRSGLSAGRERQGRGGRAPRGEGEARAAREGGDGITIHIY